MLWLAHSALVYGAICFFKHWRPMQQARVQSPRCHSTGWYNIHASCWNNVPRPGARHSHTRWAQSNTHMSIHPTLIYSICCFCRHSYRRKSIKGRPLQSSWGRCGTSIIVFQFFRCAFCLGRIPEREGTILPKFQNQKAGLYIQMMRTSLSLSKAFFVCWPPSYIFQSFRCELMSISLESWMHTLC